MRTISVTLCAIGSLAASAKAAITIANFQLTHSTVSFDISGTLEGPAPPFAGTEDGLFFVNPAGTDPGFVTPPGFERPASHIWTGSQDLVASFPLFTGDPAFSTGDYFGLHFAADLTVGEEISGSVTGVFAPGTFDPTEVTSLHVIWGHDGSEFSGGSLQTTVFVPEPSLALLLGTGLLGATLRRRRTR